MATLNSLPKCFRLTRHYIVRKRPVYHESTQSHSNVYPIFSRCSVWELSKLIPSAWLSIMMGSDGMPVFIENRFGGAFLFFMMVKKNPSNVSKDVQPTDFYEGPKQSDASGAIARRHSRVTCGVNSSDWSISCRHSPFLLK